MEVEPKKNNRILVLTTIILTILLVGSVIYTVTNLTDEESKEAKCPECNILDGVTKAEKIMGNMSCAPDDGVDLIIFIQNQNLYAMVNGAINLMHENVKDFSSVNFTNACDMYKIAFVTVNNQLRITGYNIQNGPFDESTLLHEGVEWFISYKSNWDGTGTLSVRLDESGGSEYIDVNVD